MCLLAVDQHQALSDRFGKEASDAILKTVASVIMGTVRAHDLVVRWSADKFLVILSQKRDSDLKIVAERIRKLLMATPVKIGAETINITISLSGTNALLTDTVESLLTRAHSLLALSANRGHNHTTFDETVDAHK